MCERLAESDRPAVARRVSCRQLQRRDHGALHRAHSPEDQGRARAQMIVAASSAPGAGAGRGLRLRRRARSAAARPTDQPRGHPQRRRDAGHRSRSCTAAARASSACRLPRASRACWRCGRGGGARRKRQAPVIQTQIILAIVGAVVMLVVGSSLARAFGIVGAAGLVRYRAKIDDPKDAGVMLSTLAIGLAAGVGRLPARGLRDRRSSSAVLWIVESFEPKATQAFDVEGQGQGSGRAQAEARQAAGAVPVRLRAARAPSTEELDYEVKLPLERKTDRIVEPHPEARSGRT